MSLLVPNVIRGLKSKCKAYKAATYMILSQLAVQVKLKEDLLDSLIPVLTKVYTYLLRNKMNMTVNRQTIIKPTRYE